MDEKDKEKTAFDCHKGLFEFNVMTFGLSNAPVVFQELMSVVLQGCNDFATAYLDDIMVFSSTLEENLEHLSIIFGKLRQPNFKLKLKKCSFLQLETNYLGFVISEEGIKPDEKKIEAIKSLPVPTCVREVRSFIGMCSFYRRFIPNFSQITGPVIALTRKYAHFKWSDTHQSAFEYLKDILNQTYNPIRKWLDFCMNMWCRIIYLRHIAQLLTKNLWCTVNNVSTTWFAKLLSDWSKQLFGSQALAKMLNI